MKRTFSIVLALFLFCTVVPEALGANNIREIKVEIDGVSVTYPEAPVMKNGNVLVPMRAIFEQLGAAVDYIESDQVMVYKGDQTIFYQMGEDIALINGRAVRLKIPGQIVNGTSMMPIRFVVEALGATVEWDHKNSKVLITSPPKVNAEVVRVQDGMYIELKYTDAKRNSVSEHVRLAGISPIRNGNEATSHIMAMLPAGTKVQVDIRGQRDRNKNLWAGIYKADGTWVNRELVEEGYAKISSIHEDPYMRTLLEPSQSEARSKKFGLWANTEPYIVKPIVAASLDGQVAVITEGGDLWVWGQFYEKPTKIMDGAAQVRLDSDIGVALKQDGTVWVWGFNNGGIWGNGVQGYTVIETPRQVQGLQRIVDIESNHNAIIAIDDQGAAYAWGSNYQGKLGLMEELIHTSPKKLNWSNVKEAKIGFELTIILKNDGTVWKTQPNDTDLVQVKQLSDIEIIATNENNAVLAIKKDGTVWGWDESKRTVFGSWDGFSETPERIQGLDNIVKVVLGKYHFFAISTTGELFGWGNNEYGQLGMTSMGSYMEKPEKVTSLSPVRDVLAASDKSLFLKADGTIWGVGHNPYKIFGENDKKDLWTVLYYHDLTQILFQ